MNSGKNPQKSASGSQTIFWWIVWISFTILSFFAAAYVWTPIIAKHFGSVRQANASVAWVVAVFGTWMIILVPLIILMYSKVDKAYEDARIRREKNAVRFRSIFVEPARRLLPAAAAQKLSGLPQTIQGGHLVNVTLKDGRNIENVFVSEGKEVLGVYNASDFSFQGKDIQEIEPVDFKQAPSFLANLWLRLDGVKAPE